MRDLLEAGIHFGHQTRRWNPKMKRFIYGERNGIYIIDLSKTLRKLVKAYNLVRDTTAAGGDVLFVGTKKQARAAIQRESERCGMYHITNRWLGGTLTNWETIRKSIATLTRLEDLDAKGEIDKYSKREGAQLRKQWAKLDRNLSGIKAMSGPPQLMFVIDTRREHIAVREAERIGIPCIGVVDTNCDPDDVPYPIPGNDDAIRAVNLFCKVIADAVVEGKAIADKKREEERQKIQEALAAKAKDAPEEEEEETVTVMADAEKEAAEESGTAGQ
jgi:small subunit ribosomal protein S2